MATFGEGESVVYAPDKQPTRLPDLRFLHYNDVYHVDPSSAEPVGGIARFMTLVNYYRNDKEFEGQPELLTIFSGDAFNPSLESSVTKGSHMVPILNKIGTDVACVGNHDLDFGVRQYRHLTSQCNFPWLLANVIDPALGKDVPLGNAGRTHLLTSSNGLKVGVIGLGEREWLATINTLPPDLEYRSASDTAHELVPGLRNEGADLILAVTHQREPNDNKLAEKTGGRVIDLVLGGHDHYYNHSLINGTHVLRSGTDFKQLSYIEAWRRLPDSNDWDFRITRRDIFGSIAEDQGTLEEVDHLTKALKARLEKPIGYTLAPLDARFVTVRTKESNIGNFVCDLMRNYYDAECCIMAAGTIRGDQIYPPGLIRLMDLMNCFPFEDPVIVIMATGKAILDALENSVSLYPALEGRFPQVSNIEMTFNPTKPAGSRIDQDTLTIGGAPLDLDKLYKLATRGYMGRGKDGYDSLLVEPEGGNCKEIVNEESGVLISTIMRQYFLSLKVVGRWKMWGNSMARHWENVQKGMEDSGCRFTQPRDVGMAVGVVEKVKRDLKIVGSAGGSRAIASTNGDELGSDSEFETYAKTSKSKPTRTANSTDNSRTADAVGCEQVGLHERRAVVVRKVVRKWMRLAGLRGGPTAADPLGEGEMSVNWTKAIAPRLEGRIKMVTSKT